MAGGGWTVQHEGTEEGTVTKLGQLGMVSKEMFEKRPGGRGFLGRGTAYAKGRSVPGVAGAK